MTTGADPNNGRIQKKSVFTWSVKLTETEKSNLLKGAEVKGSATVSLKNEKDTILWPGGQAGIFVRVDNVKSELGIYYATWSYLRSGGGKLTNRKHSKPQWIFCGINDLNPKKTMLIYKEGYVSPARDNYPHQSSRNMNLNIRTGGLCVLLGEEKQLECNLKGDFLFSQV